MGNTLFSVATALVAALSHAGSHGGRALQSESPATRRRLKSLLRVEPWLRAAVVRVWAAGDLSFAQLVEPAAPHALALTIADAIGDGLIADGLTDEEGTTGTALVTTTSGEPVVTPVFEPEPEPSAHLASMRDACRRFIIVIIGERAGGRLPGPLPVVPAAKIGRWSILSAAVSSSFMPHPALTAVADLRAAVLGYIEGQCTCIDPCVAVSAGGCQGHFRWFQRPRSGDSPYFLRLFPLVLYPIRLSQPWQTSGRPYWDTLYEGRCTCIDPVRGGQVGGRLPVPLPAAKIGR